MDQKQFDAVLSDAENRLRRLKVLYEQWFMGIERVEPAVPRKELEDMLARLRKEPVNNTAQRFRLQQLVQRHVTFSTHWRRIGRQIEEGTYQRDILKARRRAKTGAERAYDGPEMEVSYDVDIDADLAEALQEAERAADLASASVTPPPTEKALASRTFAAPVPVSAAAQPMAAGAFAGAVAHVEATASAGAAGAFGVQQPAVGRVAAAGAFGGAAARAFGTPEVPSQPTAANGASPTPPGGLPVAANTNGLRAASAQRGISPFALPSAGSVRPKPLDPPKPPPPPPALTPKMAGAPPTQPRMPLPPPMAAGGDAGAGAPKIAPPRPSGAHAALGAPPALGARAASASGAAVPPSAAIGAAGRGAGGGSAAAVPANGMARAAPAGHAAPGDHAAVGGSSAGAAKPVAHHGDVTAASSAARVAPVAAAASGAAGAAQPSQAAAHGARAGAGAASGGAAAASGGRAGQADTPGLSGVAAASGAARAPQAAAAAARTAGAVAKPQPKPTQAAANGGAPARPATSAGLSSSDVDRVFAQYIAARQQNAERVDNVKRDTIEKTLRGMLPQLEKKHAGKKIDFEVVVKDGKVALKPVAK